MVAVPVIDGSYTHIYRPRGDVFPGPDSEHFRAGAHYDSWVPNDHAIVKGHDRRWHAFGITHPQPPADASNIHEGEWMAFHAVAPEGPFAAHLREGAWDDRAKVLAPASRPGERNELYAPAVVAKDGRYFMVYGPNEMRLAVSDDLYAWTPKGTLFSQDGGLRDPHLSYHDGQYVMVYFARPAIWARTSSDLLHWSEAREIFRHDREGELESPLLVARDDVFYLFWCIYDGTNGPYDNRTYVHASADPFDFHKAEAIAALSAHAPEVLQDEAGDWFISSAEWPHRGIGIARLMWE